MSAIRIYDAHNHLQDDWLKPHRDEIRRTLSEIGLAGAVVNGTEEDDWPEVARLAADHAWVLPSFGLHPWRVKQRSPHWKDELVHQVDAAGARVAIGEIGLDRWIENHDIEEQKEVLLWQLQFAAERNLPTTIHCLQAWGALMDTLRHGPLPDRGFLIHAYGGPAEMVGPLAKLGAYFSFNGTHLQERKSARREIFQTIPIERLLVETDAPAMPPPPEHSPFHLPKGDDGVVVNHPANIAHIHAELAKLRELPLEELAGQVEENFRRLFG